MSLLKPDTTKELLGLLAATAVLVVPVGFFIGAVSVTILRILVFFVRWPTYEAHLNDDTLKRIWSQIHIDRDTQLKHEKLMLYAVATFDHWILPSGIHTWLIRRWNMFNVACSSIVAIGLAHLLAWRNPSLNIWQSWHWTISSLGVVAILLFNAVCAWRETMAMAKFQSHICHEDFPQKSHKE